MRLKRKIPSFIFGLSLGLIAGLGFFIFKINDVFNKLKNSGAGQITVIQQPVKNVPSQGNLKKDNKDRFKIKFKKTEKPDYAETDSILNTVPDPDLNIAREELLSIRPIKLIRIGNSDSGSDSLAARLAEVDENNSEQYTIEFWKTPLNSKGYRFTKNKLMLYGFVDFNNVLLYQVENDYFVKASGQVYHVNYGGDFKPLERVLDPDLLTRIN
ncbi:MAG TPA: hypothetical protein PLQ93_03410 [Bacteroidia bacterium]|nr:hypothetical protein [Bacteroidia bacterium]